MSAFSVVTIFCLLTTTTTTTVYCTRLGHSASILDNSSDLWRNWLLTEDEVPSQQNSPLTRRITPKSVFVHPSWCSEGYRPDGMGGCVKIVRIEETAQRQFLLSKLNIVYASASSTATSATGGHLTTEKKHHDLLLPRPPSSATSNDESSGPFQLSIPLMPAAAAGAAVDKNSSSGSQSIAVDVSSVSEDESSIYEVAGNSRPNVTVADGGVAAVANAFQWINYNRQNDSIGGDGGAGTTDHQSTSDSMPAAFETTTERRDYEYPADEYETFKVPVKGLGLASAYVQPEQEESSTRFESYTGGKIPIPFYHHNRDNFNQKNKSIIISISNTYENLANANGNRENTNSKRQPMLPNGNVYDENVNVKYDNDESDAINSSVTTESDISTISTTTGIPATTTITAVAAGVGDGIGGVSETFTSIEEQTSTLTADAASYTEFPLEMTFADGGQQTETPADICKRGKTCTPIHQVIPIHQQLLDSEQYHSLPIGQQQEEEEEVTTITIGTTVPYHYVVTGKQPVANIGGLNQLLTGPQYVPNVGSVRFPQSQSDSETESETEQEHGEDLLVSDSKTVANNTGTAPAAGKLPIYGQKLNRAPAQIPDILAENEEEDVSVKSSRVKHKCDPLSFKYNPECNYRVGGVGGGGGGGVADSVKKVMLQNNQPSASQTKFIIDGKQNTYVRFPEIPPLKSTASFVRFPNHRLSSATPYATASMGANVIIGNSAAANKYWESNRHSSWWPNWEPSRPQMVQIWPDSSYSINHSNYNTRTQTSVQQPEWFNKLFGLT